MAYPAMNRDDGNRAAAEREAARRRHPSARGNDVSHVSSVIPEVIRQLAELHNTTEDDVIRRLRGKGRGDVVTPDDVS